MSSIVRNPDGSPRFAFIHIPRTGGSSLERLSDSGQLWLEDDTHVNLGHNHLNLRELIAITRKVEDIPVYAFVRHPYSRLVSAYQTLTTHQDANYVPARNFTEFCEWLIRGDNYLRHHVAPQWFYVVNDDMVIPPNVRLFRYTRDGYVDEVRAFLREIGVRRSEEIPIPWERGTPGDDGWEAQFDELYRELRDEIYLRYRDSFNQLNFATPQEAFDPGI